jgi:Ca2+-binding EF-hand superfamily protein
MGATRESCTLYDERVTKILTENDPDNDGKMVCEDFINFYKKSC